MSQPENQENIETSARVHVNLCDNSAAIQGNYAGAIDFQKRIADGVIVDCTAYGIHLHDFDAEKLEQELNVSWRSLQPNERPNNLPRSGVAKFSGRSGELERLHSQLQKGELVAISAIVGMGGVGKTELAIQYAKAFQAAYPGGICWLLAREMNIGTQIVGYALVQLGLRVPDSIELQDQVRFCWRNWPEGDALIVLDDVTSYPEVEPYLPPENPRFKVLLTTRLKFGPPVQTLPLGVLAPEKSLELLEVLVGKERVATELAVVQSLCEWFGHLPLGLELVGRYLASMEDLSISEILFRLQQKSDLRKAIEDEALEAEQETHMLTAKRGIKAAFELSWEVLDESSQHLGKLLSMFALAPIPWELIEQVKQKYHEVHSEDKPFVVEELRADIDKLLNLYLLQEINKNVYQLHPLVREFFRNKLDKKDFNAQPPKESFQEFSKHESNYLDIFLDRYEPAITMAGLRVKDYLGNNLKPSNQKSTSNEAQQLKEAFCFQIVEKSKEYLQVPTHKLTELAIPVVNNLVEIVSTFEKHLRTKDLIRSFINLGNFYITQSDYLKAENCFVLCLMAVQERLVDKHPDIAISLSNLAYLYDLQGRYSEAEPLYLEVLKLDRDLFGEEHPSIAKNLNNLAYLYDSQGRYVEAESLYLQALALNRRLLGDDHPDIASGLSNLATLYHSQGRYEEATSFYIKTLEINQELLGEEHPIVASSLNNLANLYYSLGKYTLAEDLYLRTLKLRRHMLGEEHPDVATSLNNLAALYRIQKRYLEAESLYLQSLELRRRILGEAHPDTATSLNNLAALYEAQDRYEEAESFYLQALEVRQELLGNNHPSIATSLNNLGSLYYSKSRYEEAEAVLLKSLELQKRILGNNHPDIVTTLNNLAELYRVRGQNFEAESLFAQALDLSQRFLGDEHPISAKLRHNLEAVR